MRIPNLLHPRSRDWDPVAVTRAFGEVLGECHIHSISFSQEPRCRIWRSSCTSRAVMADLYQLYREELHKRLDLEDRSPFEVLFLWKITWRRLPTGSFFSSRGMHLQLTCLAYGHEEKILEHILFMCQQVRQVWHLTGL